MNNRSERDINYSHSLRYSSQSDSYTIQMVHRRRPWWLLLLLLPLLLLVRCEKTIDVKVVDAADGRPIQAQMVNLVCEASYLYDSGTLFATEAVSRAEGTDTAGIAHFSGLPCSVFGYIFGCLSRVEVWAESECHESAHESRNYHYTRRITLSMEPRRADLHIKIVDLETGDVLPDAILYYRGADGNEQSADSSRADAAGVATIPSMRVCSMMELLHAKYYGYADTTRSGDDCRRLAVADDSSAMRLRPLKERFTFFVKDKETRQPISGALADVRLTTPGGSVDGRQVHTSVDGKGIAVYDDAFILSTIAIHASKTHYRDGDLEGGPWTVEQFIGLPDSQRVVWLEPAPFKVDFTLTDSVSGQPVPGATVEIRITDQAGNEERTTETTNRNGIVPIVAKEGSVIEIMARKDPAYRDKREIIRNFNEKPRRIVMSPNLVKVEFRTVREENGNLLPNCDLAVSGSLSGVLAPSGSGNGSFTVEMRPDETLTIVASREGYVTNDTKVRNAIYSELSVADPGRRDIPLKLDLPPCNEQSKQKNGDNYHQESYGMGQEEGDSWIAVDFYGQADELTIYDGLGTSGRIIAGPEVIRDKRQVPFHFTQGVVTVVVKSDQSSSWEYVVQCP